MPDDDLDLIEATDDVEKDTALCERLVERLTASVERLREVLKRRKQRRQGDGPKQPPVRGVISKWTKTSAGPRQLFCLDGAELVLKQGRLADTLQVLLDSPGVYLTLPAIAERVAALSGQPLQSVGAVRQVLTRLKVVLRDVRPDLKDVILRDRKLQGYRLALGQPVLFGPESIHPVR